MTNRRGIIDAFVALAFCASVAFAQPGSGPISGGGSGGLPGPGTVTEAMLKVVNSPTDEQCLTYESTLGDFEWQSCGPVGDVVGPESATDECLARFDTGTGKLLQNSSVCATDAGDLTVAQDLNVTRAAYIGGSSYTDAEQAFDQSAVYLGQSVKIGWGPAGTPNGYGFTLDTAFSRFSSGVVRMTNGQAGIRGLFGGGAAVASASTLPTPTGRLFHVTGTTSITSIDSSNFESGVCVTLIFDDVLTLTDGGNLKLNGNFVTSADDTWSGCYDGTNWYETSRSTN